MAGNVYNIPLDRVRKPSFLEFIVEDLKKNKARVQIYTGEILFDYNRTDFATTDEDLIRSYIPKADGTILQYTPDHQPAFTVVGSQTWFFDTTDPCESGVAFKIRASRALPARRQ